MAQQITNPALEKDKKYLIEVRAEIESRTSEALAEIVVFEVLDNQYKIKCLVQPLGPPLKELVWLNIAEFDTRYKVVKELGAFERHKTFSNKRTDITHT